MQLFKAIGYLSDVPVLATVVSVALLYRSFSRSLKVFSWFILLSGVVQFASLLTSFFHQNNMPLLHVYVAAGFPLLAWFYKTVLGDFISSRLLWATVILFLMATLINSLFLQEIFRFNSNALVLESVLIIILAVFTFIFFLNSTIREAGIPDIKSLTWINAGLFIYYLSCLLIFYFGDTILFRFSKDASRLTWIFHAFFSITMNTCFLIGLWKRSKAHNL